MGPWTHGVPPAGKSTVGEFDFGPDACRDFNELRLPWYDYWVKGVDTGIMDGPRALFFTMGSNTWQSADTWPPPGVSALRQYFSAGPSGAAESLNDGRLIPDVPNGTEGADSFLYDPLDPVRTHGGGLLYAAAPPAGPWDQRGVEKRCLTYTGDPLPRDTEVTGRVICTLFGMSSAPDTDWVVRLSDVSPDGASRPVAEGILRARYRGLQTKPELLEPGKVYRFDVDLWSTSNVFKAGHRFRVAVTSSCFPRWDRNLNTGGPFGREAEGRAAINTVVRDRFRPSHITLPVKAARG
jgi:putative CocE/NonD family hydrolase